MMRKIQAQSVFWQVDALFEEFGSALTEERYALAAKQGIRTNVAWLQRCAPPLCFWLGSA